MIPYSYHMFQIIRCLIYVFLDKLLFSSFFVANPLLRWPKSFPASINFWFELFTCCFFRKICIVSCPSTQSHTMLCDVTFLTAFLHSHGGLGGSSWKIKTCEWEIIHGSRRTIHTDSCVEKMYNYLRKIHIYVPYNAVDRYTIHLAGRFLRSGTD